MTKCLHGMQVEWCAHCTDTLLSEQIKRVNHQPASKELMDKLMEIGAKTHNFEDERSDYRVYFKSTFKDEVDKLTNHPISKLNNGYCEFSCKDAFLQLRAKE